MKRTAALFIFAVLASFLAGCGAEHEPNPIADYFSTARPDSSALIFYFYDGTQTMQLILSYMDAERKRRA